MDTHTQTDATTVAVESNTLSKFTLHEPHKGGYHDRKDFASSGVLSRILTSSPRSALIDHEDKETDAMIFGAMYHTLALEPESFADQYIVMDKEQRPELDKTMASKANQAWKAELEDTAQKTGRTLISSVDMNIAHAMLAQLLNMPLMNGLMLSTGQTELAHFIREFEYFDSIENQIMTVPVRVLPDYFDARIVVDLKTTQGALTQRAFLTKVYSHGYHVQASLYIDALAQYYEADADAVRREWYWIVQEKEKPYACAVFKLSEAMYQLGKLEYQSALSAWRVLHQRDSKDIPTYNNGRAVELITQDWCAFESEERVARLNAIVLDSQYTEENEL